MLTWVQEILKKYLISYGQVVIRRAWFLETDKRSLDTLVSMSVKEEGQGDVRQMVNQLNNTPQFAFRSQSTEWHDLWCLSCQSTGQQPLANIKFGEVADIHPGPPQDYAFWLFLLFWFVRTVILSLRCLTILLLRSLRLFEWLIKESNWLIYPEVTWQFAADFGAQNGVFLVSSFSSLNIPMNRSNRLASCPMEQFRPFLLFCIFVIIDDLDIASVGHYTCGRFWGRGWR